MANLVKRQIIQDGPRNVLIKVVGILDTSDLAATGTLGAGGDGVLVLGSKVMTFGAAGLAPTVGQYVTVTGGTGTLPANTYITSVDSTTQVTLNNAATAAGATSTITLVAGAVVIADPAELNVIGNIEGVANRLSLEEIKYNIEDVLACYLYWDATTDDLIIPLEGRGKINFETPVLNTEASGVNGRILLSTQGQMGTLSFALELELRKYQK